jgi:hypothetical protein
MVEPRTQKLWAKQDQHEGDRLRLFSAVATVAEASTVLYPGSYVDVAPSFVYQSVTYVDNIRPAEQFFADVDGVQEIIAEHQLDGRRREVTFLAEDYRNDLGLDEQSFDLLVSLYAGFISEHCTRYLRVGGRLLANSSHGDAAMASLDSRYRLAAVVTSSNGDYRTTTKDLDSYLIPKKPPAPTVESLHEMGRGVAYTKSPFAYVFERVG